MAKVSAVVATLVGLLSAAVSAADCNYVSTSPVGVCTESSTSVTTASWEYVCEGGEPMQKVYTTDDCSGDSTDSDYSGNTYECGADDSCDYMMYTTEYWSENDECDGDVSYTTEAAVIVDTCISDSYEYRCNSDEDQFETCECDSDTCSDQELVTFGECSASSGTSSKITLDRCPESDYKSGSFALRPFLAISLALIAAFFA